jgi:class 3 adenylate cyclase
MDTPRKLAAILAADIAGYSRPMGLDEAGTAKALREHRAAIDPILAGHGGRVFKTTGDGVLVEFPSIVAAVESALAVQKLMAERNAGVPEDRRMLFRIGINLGDVLIEGNDILHDGVNVAARLEGLAEPGICISDDSYRQVRGELHVAFGGWRRAATQEHRTARAGLTQVRFPPDSDRIADIPIGSDGRVEDGRGSLGHSATLRFLSPLIKPNVPISGIRLSDWLHRETHGE